MIIMKGSDIKIEILDGGNRLITVKGIDLES
jgi:hypothetical protein